MLNITHIVNMDLAIKDVRHRCRNLLLEAYKQNKFGFMYSQTYLIADKAVNDELEWLLNHVYISGLDKTSNNVCFICVDHIKKQVYKRLNSPDFLPCLEDGKWLSIDEVTSNLHATIQKTIPELTIASHELPYIMAIYKFHKKI